MMKRYYDDDGHPLIIGLPVDICIFTVVSERPDPTKVLDKRSLRSLPERKLKVLLVRRMENPYQHQWALPGGFTDVEHETLEMAAVRELKEETNLDAASLADLHQESNRIFIDQIRAYYSPERDPRGWTPTVVFAALVNETLLEPMQAGGDANDAQLFEVMSTGNALTLKSSVGELFELESLAFDHGGILRDSFKFVQQKILTTTVAKTLLPEEFTIAELRQVVSTVVPEFSISTSNFTRDLVNTKSRYQLLEEVVTSNGEPKKSSEYSSRPAQLYRFKEGYETQLSIYPRP